MREGKLTEARLNDAVTRVLRVRFRLGEFDPQSLVPYSRIAPEVVGSAPHRAVSLQASRESIVLLQNRGGLLPLDKSKLKRVAVLGPLANRVVLNNYNGKTGALVTPLQGIQQSLGSAVEVLHAPGCGVVPGRGSEEALIAQAVALARGADAALIFAGTDAAVEHEGRDRKSLGLPGRQEALVKAVAAVNPKTVVVEMSAGPLTVPWIKDNIPALLQAWWGGEESGRAIAEVIFGEFNPAGRLPHTVYASESQVPSQEEYDISKGFTYMHVKGAPLFAFGHGLSYTEFNYSSLRADAAPLAAGGNMTVSLDVQNRGARAGDEVVQIYTRALAGGAGRPAHELRGFKRITLAPGQKQTVSFALPKGSLAHWDETAHAFRVQPGAFEIQAGASSADIRLKAVVEVK